MLLLCCRFISFFTAVFAICLQFLCEWEQFSECRTFYKSDGTILNKVCIYGSRFGLHSSVMTTVWFLQNSLTGSMQFRRCSVDESQINCLRVALFNFVDKLQQFKTWSKNYKQLTKTKLLRRFFFCEWNNYSLCFYLAICSASISQNRKHMTVNMNTLHILYIMSKIECITIIKI